MIKRLFDIIFTIFLLLILWPLFIVIAIWIKLDSRGPVIYRQTRVGKYNHDFLLIKFRTMYSGADNTGLITIGMNDPRITGAGAFLRKYKLDELPQLLNILAGEMSVVGPRPEVRKYVELYNQEQKRVLTVKPGLTDYASIEFVHENAILQLYPDPEEAYVQKIMPAKLSLNLKYIEDQGFATDIRILGKTFMKIIS